MSITLSIFTGCNHEANDCEVKTPHKEEHRDWNDDTPVEAEADAFADDDVDEGQTDSASKVESAKLNSS